MKLKIGILTSFDNSYEKYIAACRDLNVDHQVVDLLASDWIRQIKESGCSGFLARPPSDFQERKAFFDERLYFINKVMNYPIYPSWEELYIYENKRVMAHWLEIHDIPHPKTFIFVRKKDALEHLKHCKYPVVFKASTGAAAKLVNIVNNYRQAKKITNKIFGLIHPILASGYSGYSFHGLPVPLAGGRQRHYVIVQEFHKLKWEWRVIKIGDSYFGRKKLLKHGFASGSGLVSWEQPPDDVLHVAKSVYDKGKFLTMSVDVFETHSGLLLVNEIQAITGIRRGIEMRVNDKPGRLRLIDGKFVFEEGEFNQHDGYMERTKHFLDILSSSGSNLKNPLDDT
jgi:glutathione synthase/RimK-type ligase-like ATP-grasp enzyme